MLERAHLSSLRGCHFGLACDRQRWKDHGVRVGWNLRLGREKLWSYPRGNGMSLRMFVPAIEQVEEHSNLKTRIQSG